MVVETNVKFTFEEKTRLKNLLESIRGNAICRKVNCGGIDCDNCPLKEVSYSLDVAACDLEDFLNNL